MHLYGKIIVIKRNGTDGAHFPLTTTNCLFGRGLDCDIRIQLPPVDESQCQIEVDQKQHVFIKNLSTTSSTLLNDMALSGSSVAVSHGDIITIVDRKFRFEFPPSSKFYPLKSPQTKRVQSPGGPQTPTASRGQRRSSQVMIVAPLSPRTDNVPQDSSDLQLTDKNQDPKIMQVSNTPKLPASPIKGNLSTDLLLNIKPDTLTKTVASFYMAGPESSLNLQGQDQTKPSSPFTKTKPQLRKSISDLRRRSMPVFETEEGLTTPKAVEEPQDKPTPVVQTGSKRKSAGIFMSDAKRKRVSFGPNLSPEHFDKTLPPKTPIKKGATPGRASLSERKSLLKMKSPRNKTALANRASLNNALSPLLTEVVSPLVTNSASPILSSQNERENLIVGTEITFETGSSFVEISAESHMQETEPAVHPATFQSQTGFRTTRSSFPRVSTPKPPASSRRSEHLLPNSAGEVHLGEAANLEALGNHEDLAIKENVSSPFMKTVGNKQKPKTSLPLAEQGLFNDSVVQSQDLFGESSPKPSQDVASTNTPVADLSRKTSASPAGVARSSITPRQRRSKSVSPSPVGLLRRLDSPKQKETPVTEISPVGIRRMLKTPRQKIVSNFSVTPIGMQQVFKTPRQSKSELEELSLSGIKRILKTPRQRVSSVFSGSPVGLTNLLQTPQSILQDEMVKSSSGLEQPYKGEELAEVLLTTAKEQMKTPRSGNPGLQAAFRNPQDQTPTTHSGSHDPDQSSLTTTYVDTPRPVFTKPLIDSPKYAVGGHGVASLKTTPTRSTRSRNRTPNFGNPRKSQANIGSARNSPTANIGSPKKSPQANIGSARKSPQAKIGSPRKSPQANIGSPKNSPHANIGSPRKSQAKIGSARKSPQANIGSPKKSPQANIGSPKKSPQANIGTPKKSPQANIGSPRKSPVANIGSPKKSPQANIGSARKSLQAKIGSPRKSLSANIGNPRKSQANIGSARNSPTANIGSPRKSPQANIGSARKSHANSGSARKSQTIVSAAEKIVSPPQDFNKVVALRAILGHSSNRKSLVKGTPESLLRTTSPKSTPPKSGVRTKTPKSGVRMKTPKSLVRSAVAGSSVKSTLKTLAKNATPRSSLQMRKTPAKKTWSDIVRLGVTKTSTVNIVTGTRGTVVKTKSSPKKIGRKTPSKSMLVRTVVSTTGHIESPATIIIGKKLVQRGRTPKPLPRKGRKGPMIKQPRESAGNVSFTGLMEMFNEADAALSDSSLYADIPDTPNGPDEMFVSPLSGHKRGFSGRKSTSLVGVRELFLRKEQKEAHLVGVKELFAASRSRARSYSPQGLKRLVKTPTKFMDHVSPLGLRRLLATPKQRRVPASPSGLEALFQTPLAKKTISPLSVTQKQQQLDETTSATSVPVLLGSERDLAAYNVEAGTSELLANKLSKDKRGRKCVKAKGEELETASPHILSPQSVKRRGGRNSAQPGSDQPMLVMADQITPEPSVDIKTSNNRGRKRKSEPSPDQVKKVTMLEPTPSKVPARRGRKVPAPESLELSVAPRQPSAGSRRKGSVHEVIDSQEKTMVDIAVISQNKAAREEIVPTRAKKTTGRGRQTQVLPETVSSMETVASSVSTQSADSVAQDSDTASTSNQPGRRGRKAATSRQAAGKNAVEISISQQQDAPESSTSISEPANSKGRRGNQRQKAESNVAATLPQQPVRRGRKPVQQSASPADEADGADILKVLAPLTQTGKQVATKQDTFQNTTQSELKETTETAPLSNQLSRRDHSQVTALPQQSATRGGRQKQQPESNQEKEVIKDESKPLTKRRGKGRKVVSADAENVLAASLKDAAKSNTASRQNLATRGRQRQLPESNVSKEVITEESKSLTKARGRGKKGVPTDAENDLATSNENNNERSSTAFPEKSATRSGRQKQLPESNFNPEIATEELKSPPKSRGKGRKIVTPAAENVLVAPLESTAPRQNSATRGKQKQLPQSFSQEVVAEESKSLPKSRGKGKEALPTVAENDLAVSLKDTEKSNTALPQNSATRSGRQKQLPKKNITTESKSLVKGRGRGKKAVPTVAENDLVTSNENNNNSSTTLPEKSATRRGRQKQLPESNFNQEIATEEPKSLPKGGGKGRKIVAPAAEIIIPASLEDTEKSKTAPRQNLATRGRQKQLPQSNLNQEVVTEKSESLPKGRGRGKKVVQTVAENDLATSLEDAEKSSTALQENLATRRGRQKQLPESDLSKEIAKEELKSLEKAGGKGKRVDAIPSLAELVSQNATGDIGPKSRKNSKAVSENLMSTHEGGPAARGGSKRKAPMEAAAVTPPKKARPQAAQVENKVRRGVKAASVLLESVKPETKLVSSRSSRRK